MALGRPRKSLPARRAASVVESLARGRARRRSAAALDGPPDGGAAARLLEGDAEGGGAAALRVDDVALHGAAVAPGAEARELARAGAARLLVVERAVGLQRGARRARAQGDPRAAAVLAVELELDRAQQLLGGLDAHGLALGRAAGVEQALRLGAGADRRGRG